MFIVQVNSGADGRGDPMAKGFQGLPVGYPLGVTRTFKAAEMIVHAHYFANRSQDVPKSGYLIVPATVDQRIDDPPATVDQFGRAVVSVLQHIWLVPPAGHLARFSRSPLRVYRRSDGVFPSEDTTVSVRKPKRSTKVSTKAAAAVAGAVHEEF